MSFVKLVRPLQKLKPLFVHELERDSFALSGLELIDRLSQCAAGALPCAIIFRSGGALSREIKDARSCRLCLSSKLAGGFIGVGNGTDEVSSLRGALGEPEQKFEIFPIFAKSSSKRHSTASATVS
jgi:hypothetical protein